MYKDNDTVVIIDYKKIKEANNIGIKITDELRKLKNKYSSHKDIIDICSLAMAGILCSLSTPSINDKPHIDKELILNNVNFCTQYINEIATQLIKEESYEIREK